MAMEVPELAFAVTPEELSHRVPSATSNEQIQEVLDSIVDLEIHSMRDDRDIYESCDSLVPVYTAELFEWLGANMDHRRLFEEEMNNSVPQQDMDTTIAGAMYMQYYAIFQEVLLALNEDKEDQELEEYDKEEEEA